MKQFKLSAATALVIGALSCGWAVASEPDAAQLKTKYTPVGAERAGNSDGSIPAWTGGYTTALATDAKAGDRRSDPFSADKPTLTITAENMDKYGDKLNDLRRSGTTTIPKRMPRAARLRRAAWGWTRLARAACRFRSPRPATSCAGTRTCTGAVSRALRARRSGP